MRLMSACTARRRGPAAPPLLALMTRVVAVRRHAASPKERVTQLLPAMVCTMRWRVAQPLVATVWRKHAVQLLGEG